MGIPNEFYEAGVVDGASIWQTIAYIYAPLTKTVMITAGLVLFLVHWNSFFWPLVIIRSSSNWVVQLALASLQGETRLPNWGPVLSAALITIAVPVTIVTSLQRYFRVSLIEGGTKG
jgi:ABC-type glycerol-3-phosphate transport system permease component